MLQYDDVCKLFDIDSETGILTWKISKGPRGKIGVQAGRRNHDGYRRVKINGRIYQEHRLAWLLYYGELPLKEIEHIHGKEAGNGIWNLRLASRSENMGNRAATKNNKLMLKGVYLSKGCNNNPFRAAIGAASTSFTLGFFKLPQEAALAYNIAAIEWFGEFACLNEVGLW